MNRLPPKQGLRETKVQILLVDGNALIKQAFYGAKNEYTTKSEHGTSMHVGALVQFLRMLRNFLFDNHFSRVYVFWDGKFSGKMRYELYPDYKKSRNKDYVYGNTPDKVLMFQIRQVKEYLSNFSVRQFSHEIVESDDLIAYFCLNKDANEQITIMTNDRDICQLITDDVKVYLSDIKKTITRDNYRQVFSHHPDNLLLMKMICGDNSDDIKGIKGVKEPTLLSLFPEIADREMTLEELLAKANELKEERIAEKKKPLQAILNLLEQRTDGCQGNRIYEINRAIINLKKPMIHESLNIDWFHALMENPLVINEDGIKNVHRSMKRDGISHIIGEANMDDFLMPYKKLIERERKFFNEQQQ